jgi:hypothetical protein
MSERFPAVITIGGKIPRKLIPDLIDVINTSGAGVEWGNHNTFEGLETLTEVVGNNDHLVLCDDEARYGEFEDLECFLRNNDIPFDRHSAAWYEYDGDIVSFRPKSSDNDNETWHFHATQNGNRMVSFDKVSKVRDLLIQDQILEAAFLLNDILGDAIPPLPKFEVIP